MSALVLSTVMGAIGTAVATATGIERVYTRPTEGIQPVCAVVEYPEDEVDFDVTFGNGFSRATFPVLVVLGLQGDAATHTQLSSLVTFGVLEAIAGDAALVALGSVRVEGALIGSWIPRPDPTGGPVHTAVRFTVEVTA